jgi:hypothetical protein
MKMKKTFMLFPIFVLLAASCQLYLDPGDDTVTSGSGGQNFEIIVTVPATPVAGIRSLNVSTVSVTAKRSGFQDVESNLQYDFSANVYKGNLNVSAGEWIVSASAYDFYNVLIYSGQILLDTAEGDHILINLVHESGALQIVTDEFAAGSMDTFRASATRPDFETVIESVDIGPEQTQADLYLLNLTSGNWDVALSLLNDGYTYYSYTYTVAVTTNELTVRDLPLSPFQSKVLPVQFDPPSGIYPDGGSVDVTLSCATPGAFIRYTLDGNNPSSGFGSTYSGGQIIPIDTPTTIKAIAYDYSSLEDSNVVSILYQPQLPLVEFDIEGGPFSTQQTITLTCSATASNVTIYYRTDGGEFESSSGMTYIGPITVNETTEIKAIARRTGYHDSPIVSNIYTMQMPEVGVSPPGGTFDIAQEITLSCSDIGEGIYYTTNGDYPNATNGTLYSAPFTLNQDTTLQAAAVKTGWALSPVEAVFEIFLTPALASPAGSIDDTTPLLEWEDVVTAESYEIRYAKSTEDIELAVIHSADESQLQILSELDVNTEYSWQAQAVKPGKESGWSTAGTFIIEIDGGITVVPHNTVIDISLDLEDGPLEIVTGDTRTVTATSNPAAESYQWYLDGVSIAGEIESSIAIGEGLSAGTTYTLTVIAFLGEDMASESVEFDLDFILALGIYYEGGLIFYLDGAGGGLVAAQSDQSTGIQWRELTDPSLSGATSTGFGTGQSNTDLIVNEFGSGIYAAKICDDLDLEGYNDWFLPSSSELSLMYQNLKVSGIGDFADWVYWSSSEYDTSYEAKTVYFATGTVGYDEMYEAYYVRAVRAF